MCMCYLHFWRGTQHISVTSAICWRHIDFLAVAIWNPVLQALVQVKPVLGMEISTEFVKQVAVLQFYIWQTIW